MLELAEIEKKKVKISGEIYELTTPSFSMAENYYELMNKDGGDKAQFKLIREYLVMCGMPDEVIKKLAPEHVVQIVEYLNPKKK